MTRTIPVNGRFTRRQRQVYDAVLGILRKCIAGLAVGKKIKDWQKEAEQMTERELVNLGLLTVQEIKRQDPEQPAFKKHFMHGVGHPIGLDVHDVGLITKPMEAGWVMTVEPGIYIPKENFAVRLENTVLVTKDGPVDLMSQIPIEAEDIERLMQEAPVSSNGKNGHAKTAKARSAAQMAR
jgi:Xaa-Pro aminopeptidase